MDLVEVFASYFFDPSLQGEFCANNRIEEFGEEIKFLVKKRV